jgi:hypothetical protein
MNHTHDTPALDALIAAAADWLNYCAAHARRDDPHRWSTLAAEFDGKRAMTEVSVRGIGSATITIEACLAGERNGEPHTVALDTLTVRCPADVEGGVH